MASVTETELEVHHEQSGYLRPTLTPAGTVRPRSWKVALLSGPNSSG